MKRADVVQVINTLADVSSIAVLNALADVSSIAVLNALADVSPIAVNKLMTRNVRSFLCVEEQRK